ncbi:MAG: DUF1289 domain-containing protein [Pseudazoarcus pumilus]|nr:DUF1289 domain-containing protein [Pseudazoarcus pumilus]
MRELKHSGAGPDIAPRLPEENLNIQSPCVRQCCIDEATGLCVGCLRTLDEICGWSGFEAGEKLRVLEAVNTRRTQRGQP